MPAAQAGLSSSWMEASEGGGDPVVYWRSHHSSQSVEIIAKHGALAEMLTSSCYADFAALQKKISPSEFP